MKKESLKKFPQSLTVSFFSFLEDKFLQTISFFWVYFIRLFFFDKDSKQNASHITQRFTQMFSVSVKL